MHTSSTQDYADLQLAISKSFFGTFSEMNIGDDTDTILTHLKVHLMIYKIEPVVSKNDKDKHKNS